MTEKPLPPRRLLLDGIRNGSTEEISRALAIDRSLLPFVLSTVLSKDLVGLAKYLIDTEGANAEGLNLSYVIMAPSIELADLLVSRGWNINQRADRGIMRGRRLLDQVTDNEQLIRWCLDHGAQISDGKEGENPLQYNLTENAAALATVSCMKLLRSRGVPLGRRVLHKAASSATSSDKEERRKRMAMLEYLVEEEHTDVNQLDTVSQLPNHWGTPIMYAARLPPSAEVVQWLLERGADPGIKDCWGNHDALSLAEFSGNEKVVQILRTWMEAKKKDQD